MPGPLWWFRRHGALAVVQRLCDRLRSQAASRNAMARIRGPEPRYKLLPNVPRPLAMFDVPDPTTLPQSWPPETALIFGREFDPAILARSLPDFGLPTVDLKIPWELARLQGILPWALAYAATRDEAWSQRVIDLVLLWRKTATVGEGPLWGQPMDAAIRGTQLAVVRTLLGEDPETDRLWLDLLWEHGVWLSANLEIHPDLRSNHYLADLAGIYFVARGAPELAESAKWAEFAQAELEREIHTQVLPDGGSFESSVAYHAFALELFLYPALVAKRTGNPFSPAYHARLEAMTTFLREVTDEGGILVQIGDNDSGRLFRLDHRPSLDRRDLLETSERFLGITSVQDVPRHSPTHRLFSDFGLLTLRSGDAEFFGYATQVGQNGFGGHQHNDKGAFEWVVRGRKLIADPGTGTYTGDPDRRHAFRSTAAHPVLQLGGAEQNRITRNDPFFAHDDARPTITGSEESDDWLIHTIRHSGFRALGGSREILREFRWHAATGTVVVVDRVVNESAFNLTWSLQLPAGPRIGIYSVELDRLPVVPPRDVTLSPLPRLGFSFESEGEVLGIAILEVGRAQVEIVDATYSPGYLELQPVKAIHCTGEFRTHHESRLWLIPVPKND